MIAALKDLSDEEDSDSSSSYSGSDSAASGDDRDEAGGSYSEDSVTAEHKSSSRSKGVQRNSSSNRRQ